MIYTLNTHFKKKIEVQLIYDVVLVSSAQQSDSVTHVYISILFQILFHYSLLQDIEYSSVLYSRSLLFTYFIYSRVYMLSQTPNLSPVPAPPSPFVTLVSSISVGLFLFCK